MWNGNINQITKGWALCNGQNERPDLSNKFVFGGGVFPPIGLTKGSQSIKLNTSQIQSHNHGMGHHHFSGTLVNDGWGKSTQSSWANGAGKYTGDSNIEEMDNGRDG
jgi:hypothetical protein